jgi:tetratricopeptide (TPR) repeat protein
MTHGGMLIKDVIRHESKLSPDIFSAMLTGVSNFVNETLSIMSGEEKEGSLNSLGYENYRILIESGKNANLVVILTGKENEFLLSDMKEILRKTEKNYGKVLDEWDGDEKRVKGTEKILQPLILSGKYDGIYYGKEDPKARRNLLFENVSMGLIRQTQRTPTLLCIEDLQWVDPSTLALMHYVARNTKNRGLLTLGTYRPEEVAITDGKGHPLTNAMQLMDREDLHKKMELQRLSREILDEFLSSLLGKTDFSDEFVNRIFKETEGNPLFIIQLVKFLVEENIIRTDDGVWKLTLSLEDISIPPKVYHVIERRLDRVEKEYRRVLDFASVIGETFSSDTLTSALKQERVQVLEQLREIEHKHRLVHSQNGNYKFDHAKIKEVLYEEIPRNLRGEYHLTIANAVEELNKDNIDEVVGELAFHYYKSRDKNKALNYLLKAAEKAKREYSNEEAIRFYSKALELEKDPLKRSSMFEEQGDIYGLIGEFDKSKESYEYALGLTDGSEKITEIKVKIGDVYNRIGEYDESIKICTEALSDIKERDCREEAFALEIIGVSHWLKGEFNTALKLSRKSLKIWEKIGDQKGIGTSLNFIGIIYTETGLLDKAIEYMNRSLKIREKIGDKQALEKVFHNIGIPYTKKGEYDLALEHFEKSLEIGEKIGNQFDIAIHLTNIGEVCLYIKDYDRALDCLRRSQKISERVGNQYNLAYAYNYIAEVYLKKKDLRKALDFTNRAFNFSKENNLTQNVANSRRIFGMIYLEQKKWKESIDEFEESLKIFNEIGMTWELANTHFEFGMMWKAKDDVDKAKEHFHQAIDIYEKLKLEKKVEEIKAGLKTL